MQIIVFHNGENDSTAGPVLLRKAISDEIAACTLFTLLRGDSKKADEKIVLIPRNWKAAYVPSWVEGYDASLPADTPSYGRSVCRDWLVISNGEYYTGIDPMAVVKQLNGQAPDVLAINVDSRFQSGMEIVRVASDGGIAGFRRFYDNSILPGFLPRQWPHHLLINVRCLDKLAPDGKIPADFGALMARCLSGSLDLKSVQVGANLLHLATERGLLELLTRCPTPDTNDGYRLTKDRFKTEMPANVRIVGHVLMGTDVVISEGALIVGPSLIGSRARIGSSAVIRASVIGSELSIQPNSFTQRRVFFDNENMDKPVRQSSGFAQFPVSLSTAAVERKNNFRMWPVFSYARLGKRIADVAASILVISLFTPLFPIIALAVKLTSPGPVLFKHRREGLHGREFNCIKFRTMIVGSDEIQQRLRSRNQVDGPQFKMKKDPRITAVGRFLRDTFIDEIPQFINILRGDMSVVGPRPSPRAENVACAPWRDCRLSVRPGVTGLWQISRTRHPGRDFQEWIYYDTTYVRHVSLRLDLFVVWKTTVKLTRNFINQF